MGGSPLNSPWSLSGGRLMFMCGRLISSFDIEAVRADEAAGQKRGE